MRYYLKQIQLFKMYWTNSSNAFSLPIKFNYLVDKQLLVAKLKQI